jgi:spore coat protein H
VFRGQGFAAPAAGFVEVTLDTGSGPALIGLYALTEIPDEPLLKRNFASATGNLYKPDGRGAHFVSFVEQSFHKQNNDANNYLDIQQFIGALHADKSTRVSWRATLAATFNMQKFADFFAVNQAIGNWDTYGGYAHNFFLYNDPAAQRLEFMPWDFDLSFDGTGANDLSLRSYEGKWPLLQAVARDVEYATRYQSSLAGFASSEMANGKLAVRVDALVALVTPAVLREDASRPGAFQRMTDGVANLKSHLTTQTSAIATFLASHGAALRVGDNEAKTRAAATSPRSSMIQTPGRLRALLLRRQSRMSNTAHLWPKRRSHDLQRSGLSGPDAKRNGSLGK